MRKITDLIVKYRYAVLVIFVILTGVCLFLSTKVNINEDISKFGNGNVEGGKLSFTTNSTIEREGQVEYIAFTNEKVVFKTVVVVNSLYKLSVKNDGIINKSLKIDDFNMVREWLEKWL